MHAASKSAARSASSRVSPAEPTSTNREKGTKSWLNRWGRREMGRVMPGHCLLQLHLKLQRQGEIILPAPVFQAASSRPQYGHQTGTALTVHGDGGGQLLTVVFGGIPVEVECQQNAAIVF